MTMFEIPLFPLNTVLFPGTPLQLHIFEERYKSLVSYCRKANSPFGVVLIQKGAEAFGPMAEPYSIGCTAQITHIQPLGQGRMNIIALGLERFRILTTRSNLPYLVGIVEPIPIDPQGTEALDLAAKAIQPWFERYISQMNRVEGGELKLPDSVSDPLSFAYISAMLLQIPAKEKQDLLEIDDPLILIETLQGTYRREVALIRVLLQTVIVEQGDGISFSRN
jgi:Lon protease-like protein